MKNKAFAKKHKGLRKIAEVVVGIMVVTLTISVIYTAMTATMKLDPTPYRILGTRSHFLGYQTIALERSSDGVRLVALADNDLYLQTLGAREKLRVYRLNLGSNMPSTRIRWIDWDETAR